MVNTTEMLSGEYADYVLRYSRLQSGFAEYNRRYPIGSAERDEVLVNALLSNSVAIFYGLMDNLENLESESRAKALDYFIEQLDRCKMTDLLSLS